MKQFIERGLHQSGIRFLAEGSVTDDDLLNDLGDVALGAITSQLFLGWFVDWMHGRGFEGRAQWDPAYYLYAAVLLVGAFGWLFIDVTRPIERQAAVPVDEGLAPLAATQAVEDPTANGVRAGHPAPHGIKETQP